MMLPATSTRWIRSRLLFFIPIFSTMVSISESQKKWTPPKVTPYPATTDESTLFKIIEGIGLTKEVYKVVTKDGYILCLTRLVLPRKNNKKDKGIPMLMVNGLFLHSEAWLLHSNPLNNPEAIHFLTHGYDIWLGDQRGTMRSRGHKNYNHKTDKAYWKFSFHETGIYDLPAFIDFILRKTGKKKVCYAGLSLGTTFSFVMLSERPEYNDKVHIAILLMPVGDMPVLSTRALGTRIFFNFVLNLMEYYKVVGSEALFLDETSFRLHMLRLCENSPHLFTWSLGISSGHGLSMDMNYICPQAALQHGGTSIRTCLHTIQLFRRGEFRKLDRGAAENKKEYGTSEPPLYNYTKITAPLAIYYSDLDEYSPGHVVKKMFPKFGGEVYSCLFEKTHHTEALIGMQFGDMYNSEILEVLDSATGRAGATKEKLHSSTCQWQ